VTPEQALRWVARVCEALAFAHARGIVHRDLKPENVLLDEEGCPRLADFGLAKLIDADEALSPSLTQSRALVGSPHYMPPEQLQGVAVDHRADVFALGAVLYELLTGTLPLGRFPLPSATPGVPAALDAIVLRCLERDPPARYASVDQLRVDLESARERLYPTGSRFVLVGVARRTGLLAAAATAAVAGLLCGLARWSKPYTAYDSFTGVLPNGFIMVELAFVALVATAEGLGAELRRWWRVARIAALLAVLQWFVAAFTTTNTLGIGYTLVGACSVAVLAAVGLVPEEPRRVIARPAPGAPDELTPPPR
jgi:hypothetical protein